MRVGNGPDTEYNIIINQFLDYLHEINVSTKPL